MFNTKQNLSVENLAYNLAITLKIINEISGSNWNETLYIFLMFKLIAALIFHA